MGDAAVVRSVRTEDLDAGLRATVIRVCVESHADDDFERLFTDIPVGGLHVLGYDGSELVSHAVATTRWLQPAGHPPLATAYVDAVSTLPSHQGRGHATAVVRRLAREVAGDHAIACLETELAGFYERLGWEPWRGPLAGRHDDGTLVPTPEQSGVMVLRLPGTPVLDLDALLTIECQPRRIW